MCSSVREAQCFSLDLALVRLALLQSRSEWGFAQRVLQRCYDCVGEGQAGVALCDLSFKHCMDPTVCTCAAFGRFNTSLKLHTVMPTGFSFQDADQSVSAAACHTDPDYNSNVVFYHVVQDYWLPFSTGNHGWLYAGARHNKSPAAKCFSNSTSVINSCLCENLRGHENCLDIFWCCSLVVVLETTVCKDRFTILSLIN